VPLLPVGAVDLPRLRRALLRAPLRAQKGRRDGLLLGLLARHLDADRAGCDRRRVLPDLPPTRLEVTSAAGSRSRTVPWLPPAEKLRAWEEALAGRGPTLGAAWLDGEGDVLVAWPSGSVTYGVPARGATPLPLSSMAGQVDAYGGVTLLAASLGTSACDRIASCGEGRERSEAARREAEQAGRSWAVVLRSRRLRYAAMGRDRQRLGLPRP
jgi:hypothetical protein